jgi:hypothetical protein
VACVYSLNSRLFSVCHKLGWIGVRFRLFRLRLHFLLWLLYTVININISTRVIIINRWIKVKGQDSRDLGMLWSLRDSLQHLPLQQQKKVGRGLYPPHFSFSFYLAHTMPLAGVYKLVWFGPYTRFTSFFLFSLLWLSSICYHSYIFCRSRFSIFHLYIYNHVTVHHTHIHALLSWTTSTYHIHSYLQSLSSRLPSLQHAPSLP